MGHVVRTVRRLPAGGKVELGVVRWDRAGTAASSIVFPPRQAQKVDDVVGACVLRDLEDGQSAEYLMQIEIILRLLFVRVIGVDVSPPHLGRVAGVQYAPDIRRQQPCPRAWRESPWPSGKILADATAGWLSMTISHGGPWLQSLLLVEKDGSKSSIRRQRRDLTISSFSVGGM